jgi:hypothetical protein
MVKVLIPKSIIDRRDWVRYLVLVNWHAKELGELVRKAPDAAFSKFLETQVQNYLQGAAPPNAIQSAVMNLADDFLAGREVTVKAGDYIALQNYFQGARK